MTPPQTYLDAVEDALLVAGRDALMLSALDVQTVVSWQERGVPLHVVMKGIRQGLHVFERYRKDDETFPKRLTYFARWIDALFESWRGRVMQAPPSTPAPATSSPVLSQAAAEDAGRAREGERLWGLLRDALRALAGSTDVPFDAVVQQVLDEVLTEPGLLGHDPDQVIARALACNQALYQGFHDQLPADALARARARAIQELRARYPFATDRALAPRIERALRDWMSREHGLGFIDLKEMTR
jgi:hypothetical protein